MKRRRVRVVEIVGMVSVMQRRADVRHALDNERPGRLWAAAIGVVGWSGAVKGLLPPSHYKGKLGKTAGSTYTKGLPQLLVFVKSRLVVRPGTASFV